MGIQRLGRVQPKANASVLEKTGMWNPDKHRLTWFRVMRCHVHKHISAWEIKCVHVDSQSCSVAATHWQTHSRWMINGLHLQNAFSLCLEACYSYSHFNYLVECCFSFVVGFSTNCKTLKHLWRNLKIWMIRTLYQLWELYCENYTDEYIMFSWCHPADPK